MNTLSSKNIFAGSLAYGWWTTVFEHSMLRLILVRCGATVSGVVNGSHTLNFVRTRIWPVLLVGDYLDRPLRIDSATLEGSVIWPRLRNVLARSAAGLRSVPGLLSLPESGLLGKFHEIGRADAADAKRRAMAFAILFTAVYYAFRILVQIWIPAAQYRAGWTAGPVLALILATSLTLISKR